MAEVRITPCLWFDGQAAAAVDFHTALSPDSRVGRSQAG